jgi:hypothetical protein
VADPEGSKYNLIRNVEMFQKQSTTKRKTVSQHR